MHILTRLVVCFCCLGCFTIHAAEVSKDRAVSAVKGWLKLSDNSFGECQGRRVTGAVHYKDVAGKGSFYKVDLDGEGFVITSADDEFEPIIAFSNMKAAAMVKGDPLYALLSKDARCQVLSKSSASRSNSVAKQKWENLINAGSSTSSSRGVYSVSDVRVAPLLKTKWGQDKAAGKFCYNRFTPQHYVCGCVATAMAQLMAYHKYPDTGIGMNEKFFYVDGVIDVSQTVGGDGLGGRYQWADMPDRPDVSLSNAQADAIGRLCYDAGLSVHMRYSADWSGAFMADAARALYTTFNYSNAVMISDYNIGLTKDAINSFVCSNLDARLPVLFGIYSKSLGGHAVVCDGYGYRFSTLYHHLNMGWDGYYDLWYNLPLVDVGNHSFSKTVSIIGNIYKSGYGGIISGRVLDKQGNPVAGVTVSCDGQQAVTDIEGIYGVTKLNHGRKTLKLSGRGYSATLDCLLPLDGNLWGKNFTVDNSADLAVSQGVGWSDKIVISTIKDALTDSDLYSDSDNVYCNFAVANVSAEVDKTTKVGLYLDNRFIVSLKLPPMKQGEIKVWRNVPLLQLKGLAMGYHELKLAVDDGQLVDESNELNNVYTKQFYVGPHGIQGKIVPMNAGYFLGGVPQEVSVLFSSYLLGDGTDCYIECAALPQGWSVDTKHFYLKMGNYGTAYSRTFSVTPSAAGGSGEIVWKLYDAASANRSSADTLLDTVRQRVSSTNTLPSVNTLDAQSITGHEAVINGSLVSLNKGQFVRQGVEISKNRDEWSQKQVFVYEKSKSPFNVVCSGLERTTVYYYRCFVETYYAGSVRRGYGTIKSFKTKFAFDYSQFDNIADLQVELNCAGISSVLDACIKQYQVGLLKAKEYIDYDLGFVQSLINMVNDGKKYDVITLDSGWNLVSPPFANLNVADVLNLNSEVTSIFGYDNQAYHLCQKSDDGALVLEAGKAYWAFSMKNCAALVEETPVQKQQLSLCKGWNLIGLPGRMTLGQFSNCYKKGVSICWGWSSIKGCYEQVDELNPGKGYWVNAVEAMSAESDFQFWK